MQSGEYKEFDELRLKEKNERMREMWRNRMGRHMIKHRKRPVLDAKRGGEIANAKMPRKNERRLILRREKDAAILIDCDSLFILNNSF